MSTITIPQRVEIVQFYYENGRSFAAVGRIMRGKYGAKAAPSDRSIKRIIDQFLETASAAPVELKGRVRFQPVRSEENKERVTKFFRENPTTSIRKAAKELNISDRSLRRILNDVEFEPYKIKFDPPLSEDTDADELDWEQSYLKEKRVKN